MQHQLGLHPLIVSDLLEGRQHPKFERLGDHLYLTVWDILPRNDDPADTDGDITMLFNELELRDLMKHKAPPDRRCGARPMAAQRS
ncbi:Mg2+ and Co2+ transporter CorA [Agromyces cerinus]|uniref:hypothetical protein n=1 Tax=Agromyces cerinus TaxID=33878 RepID=UPI00195BB1FF|nr:hypothetical protein [Agromyces cerinus]MBM7831260.1 Mg2+ and Co2+ transporter CorA [Agromyces cerinus]